MTYWSETTSTSQNKTTRPGCLRHRLGLFGLSLKTNFQTLPYFLVSPRSGHLKINPRTVARLALPNHRILLVIRGLPTFPGGGFQTDRLWVLTPTHFVAIWHTPTSVHRRFIDRQKISSLTSKIMPDKLHLDLTLKAGVVHLYLTGVPVEALTAMRNHLAMRRRHHPISAEAKPLPAS